MSSVGDYSVESTLYLRNADSNGYLMSNEQPSLAYFNGRVWLVHRGLDNNIYLCSVRDIENIANWQVYNITTAHKEQTNATTNKAPSICAFQGYLYIAWKSINDDYVYYQRTDTQDAKKITSGGWFQRPRKSIHKTTEAPVLTASKDQLYMASLDESLRATGDRIIWLTTSEDGTTWPTSKSMQSLEMPDGKKDNASSPYPPTFSMQKTALKMIWGSAVDDAVRYADINPKASVRVSKNTDFQTKIGNGAVYRVGEEWVFTTVQGGNIELRKIGQEDDSLTISSASGSIPSAAVVPGIPIYKQWRILLGNRDTGNYLRGTYIKL